MASNGRADEEPTHPAKLFMLKQMRRRAMQPLWDRLSHLARIGQNYWATELSYSGELAVLDRLRPKLNFDVGANVGHYAVAASRYGQVFAFEPSSEAFAKIPQSDAIRAFNFALGDEEGRATLHGSGDTIASLIEQCDPRRPVTSSEEVRVATVDAFCAEHGIAEIDLLKIDVEGFEYQVLRGARRVLPSIRHVQFEFGSVAGTPLRAFFDLMPNRLFYRIVSDGVWPVAYREELETPATINYQASLPS